MPRRIVDLPYSKSDDVLNSFGRPKSTVVSCCGTPFIVTVAVARAVFVGSSNATTPVTTPTSNKTSRRRCSTFFDLFGDLFDISAPGLSLVEARGFANCEIPNFTWLVFSRKLAAHPSVRVFDLSDEEAGATAFHPSSNQTRKWFLAALGVTSTVNESVMTGESFSSRIATSYRYLPIGTSGVLNVEVFWKRLFHSQPESGDLRIPRSLNRKAYVLRLNIKSHRPSLSVVPTRCTSPHIRRSTLTCCNDKCHPSSGAPFSSTVTVARAVFLDGRVATQTPATTAPSNDNRSQRRRHLFGRFCDLSDMSAPGLSVVLVREFAS